MRAPFLDHRLIEFAFGGIPSFWKAANGQLRRVERMVARRMLPQDLNLERKQGFSIPLDQWLRADGCAIVRSVWRHLPDCIQRTEVERLISGEMRGRANGSRLFALTMLGIAARNCA
jgi:asparagine synthase (glutamine-hydrolysing)